MAPAEFVWVEAQHHVAQLRVVFDLERGERYLIPRDRAEQLILAGAVTLAPATTKRLEAAALAAPSRRG